MEWVPVSWGRWLYTGHTAHPRHRDNQEPCRIIPGHIRQSMTTIGTAPWSEDTVSCKRFDSRSACELDEPEVGQNADPWPSSRSQSDTATFWRVIGLVLLAQDGVCHVRSASQTSTIGFRYGIIINELRWSGAMICMMDEVADRYNTLYQ